MWYFSFYFSGNPKIKGHMSCVSMHGTVVAEIPAQRKKGGPKVEHKADTV